MFPSSSLLPLGTVAHLGLILFIFLVGVEMDVTIIHRMGRRSLVIALSGMAMPFCIGTCTSFLFRHDISSNVDTIPFLLFLGVALSVTAFPVLARILAETKLINTELGRTAMSAAIINDMIAWIFLALSVSLSNDRTTPLLSVWVLLSGSAFILLCFYVVRPIMIWAGKKASAAGEGVTDLQLCAILVGLMLSAMATDSIGVHVSFGAFVYGLVVPSGSMGKAVVEKLEDFVTGVLLPLFFVISGLRMNLGSIDNPLMAGLLLLVFFLSSVAKIAGTVFVAMHYTMTFRDGLALGFLMNTRGLIEMIILNIGKDREVLDPESFAILVLSSVAMTSLVTPVVTYIHSPSHRAIGYKRRTIQASKLDTEICMLACFHSSRHVAPLISLLALSHPTKRAPIFLYALHLNELTGRASTLLAASTSSSPTHPSASTGACLSFHSPSPFISIHPLSAVSPFPTMHIDVSIIAKERHVALILLPFHKHLAVDGDLEAASNPGLRAMNINVLSSAPCSVALFVDRGLNSLTSASHHVAVFFFGGPHDREALSFAWRMADNPLTTLSLLRFLPIVDPRVLAVITDSSGGSLTGNTIERERQADEEFIAQFKRKNAGNERVKYGEVWAGSGEEVVSTMRGIESAYDLYVVGKNQGGAAAGLTAGLTEWAECPELGPIGDFVASSDFAATASVLVVQQYAGEAPWPELRLRPTDGGGLWDRMSRFEISWGGRC